MDLILFLKLFRDEALRIGIGIEFHSLGAVYEYDLSNMDERDLGTAYALLTDYHSVRLWVDDFSVIDPFSRRIAKSTFEMTIFQLQPLLK